MEEYLKSFIASIDCEKESNIIDGCEDDVREYLETKKREILKDNEEYKELNRKIEQIKTDYPNVRSFIEDNEVIKLSDEELQAVLDIADIQVDLNMLEMRAIFKQGAKETVIFLKQMKLL